VKSTHPVGKRSCEQINSTDLLGLGHQEAVRLNAYRDREVDEAFVSLVDGASDGPQNDLVVRQQVQDFQRDVCGQQVVISRHLKIDLQSY
jgi:hypothetical protein